MEIASRNDLATIRKNNLWINDDRGISKQGFQFFLMCTPNPNYVPYLHSNRTMSLVCSIDVGAV